jgi:DNA polymerase III epsilon subunit-like protein
MKLLFLDTETTALVPQSGQVIELGAIVCELDPVALELKIESKFEELVALRATMDERITRITGITELELSTAAPLHKVQDLWINFIQKLPADTLLIGHSLGFDLTFLKAENWLLPANYKTTDTLELAKILCPDLNAINLEFLAEKLQLDATQSQLSDLAINPTNLKPHRALHDTINCLNLFNFQLQKLKNSKFDTEIYGSLLNNFLPLDITFFATNAAWNIPVTSETINKNIYLDGKIIQPGLYDKINSNPGPKAQRRLLELATQNLTRNQLQNVLQIYTLFSTHLSQPKLTLKLHGKDLKDFQMAEMLLDHVNANDEIASTSGPKTLAQFEAIITQIKYISEHDYKLSKLISLFELYIEAAKNLDSTSAYKLEKIVTCYDFLLFTLQPFWQKSEYFYNPNQLKPEEFILRRKLTELSELFLDFDIQKLEKSELILRIITQNIEAEYTNFFDTDGKFLIQPEKKLLLRNQGHQISISTLVHNFSLSHVLQNTFQIHPNLTLETYYNEEDFENFIKLIGLTNLFSQFQPKIKYLGSPDSSLAISDQAPSLANFLDQKKEIAGLENKFVLLLNGQNSGLKDMERQMTQSYEPNDYLVLGESGSLTKVVSKMIKYKKGLVAVKTGDFYYIAKYLDLFEFAEIWIINLPYFPLHKYWQTLAQNSTGKDEYLQTLKWMYLKAQANFVAAKTGQKVNFLKSYR